MSHFQKALLAIFDVCEVAVRWRGKCIDSSFSKGAIYTNLYKLCPPMPRHLTATSTPPHKLQK
ncbi:hypothetical protein Scep_022042 [Stephania cephalantha]|uniref:Uncharacterized protein n=1 Tax=Stephania cephalantha TaxID=152367 RepID=A0AAP0F9N8_9MAGN